MATIISPSLSGPAVGHAGPLRPFAGLKAFWHQFVAKALNKAFNPYRPELHYMRGPGPAWHAKHGTEAAFRLKPRDL
jgi:hypothetical protein